MELEIVQGMDAALALAMQTRLQPPCNEAADVFATSLKRLHLKKVSLKLEKFL